MNEQIFKAMAQSIIEGEPEDAENLALQAIELGIDPLEAINDGFVIGVDHVGELFSCGDAFLPDLVMAGEAMKAAVNVLEPEMVRQGTERKMLGTVVLGTIEGDIHDIGKTLVGTMLSASGFKVIDLGVDVPAIKLVETARAEKADIIGVSSLLTTTMVRQRIVIQISQYITEAAELLEFRQRCLPGNQPGSANIVALQQRLLKSLRGLQRNLRTQKQRDLRWMIPAGTHAAHIFQRHKHAHRHCQGDADNKPCHQTGDRIGQQSMQAVGSR